MLTKLKLPQTTIKEYVCCNRCSKELEIVSEDFLSFWGNVHIGMYGGIIGNNINNLDESVLLTGVTIYCKPCFYSILALNFGDELFDYLNSHLNNVSKAINNLEL